MLIVAVAVKSSSTFTCCKDIGLPADGNALFMQYWLPIFLDRYSIEDGTQLVSSGMVGSHIKATTKHKDSATSESETYGIIGHSLNTNFANVETQGGTAISGSDLDKLADGVFLGFKPRLKSPSSYSSTAKTIGNQDIFRYNIAAS